MEQEKDGAAKCETIQATAPNSFKEGSIRELHAGGTEPSFKIQVQQSARNVTEAKKNAAEAGLSSSVVGGMNKGVNATEAGRNNWGGD